MLSKGWLTDLGTAWPSGEGQGCGGWCFSWDTRPRESSVCQISSQPSALQGSRSQLGAPPGCGHFKFLITETQRGAGTCLRSLRMSTDPRLGHLSPKSALPPVGFLTSALWCPQGEETKGKQASMPRASYILAETSAARIQPSHFTYAITEAL